jgi:hypothetical protein
MVVKMKFVQKVLRQPPIFYKVIYREIAIAWKYVEKLTQERTISYLEDI